MDIERVEKANMEHLVTPYFRHQTIENVPQSEIQRKPVMDTREVVELRFAGDKNYAPIFPVDAMFRRDGHSVVTYAERFASQYAEFLSGAAQTASGTPLEQLSSHGITPAQISLCRAVKIYSVEALDALDGQNLRNLGMHANALKEMARAYMADRVSSTKTADEMQKLRDEIAALKALVPQESPGPADAEEALQAADDEYAALTDSEIKDRIADLVGERPRGNPSRTTLVQSLRELESAA